MEIWCGPNGRVQRRELDTHWHAALLGAGWVRIVLGLQVVQVHLDAGHASAHGLRAIHRTLLAEQRDYIEVRLGGILLPEHPTGTSRSFFRDAIEAIYFIEDAVAERRLEAPPEQEASVPDAVLRTHGEFAVIGPADDSVVSPDLPRWRAQRARLESFAYTDLPTMAVERADKRIGEALSLWRGRDGRGDADLEMRMIDTGIAETATWVYLDGDRRLRFRWQGRHIPLWRPDEIQALPGRLMVDQPDPDYAAFAEQRVWKTIMRGEPAIQACRGWVGTAEGLKLLHYVAMVLPVREQANGPVTGAISVGHLVHEGVA